MGKNFEGIKRQRFGVELEMTGLTRAEAARAVADYFGTEPSHWGGSYDRYVISDEQCREWKIMSDGSIDCQTHNGRSASKSYSVEFVTPVCTYDDIPTIQELVRRLRHAGAICNKMLLFISRSEV